jgi:sec-independent protein translocase protein TatB
MPSFSDSIFLFILALLLFGPKRLPVLARELGKWVGEFRKASNEFKMQMEDELRAVEQADRQKQISAMEAAAPVAPALDEPEHPHMLPAEIEAVSEEPLALEQTATAAEPAPEPAPTPLPIATAGELSIMPPATGLPTPRHAASNGSALSSLLNAIPEAPATPAQEAALHGD